MVPPCSDRISRVPPYSRTETLFTHTGLSPTLVWLSRHFCLLRSSHWADPRSLATTRGVSIDILSYGYWDVSLPRVRFIILCIQIIIPKIDHLLVSSPNSEKRNWKLEKQSKGGFPHSEISGSTGVDTSPELIAACHVLHRLWSPRHPPDALWHLNLNHAQNEICFFVFNRHREANRRFVRSKWTNKVFDLASCSLENQRACSRKPNVGKH